MFLVVAQIILLSRWFIQKKPSKKNPVKKTNQKNLVQIVRSKLTCRKWHSSQVGHGGKKTIRKVFFTKISCQKS
jgi:hypothetical protein